MKIKILIHDRNYSTWSFIDEDTYQEPSTQPIVSPLEHKLFSKDVILYDPDTESFSVEYSHVRSGTSLAGVLVLAGNRTFGTSTVKKKANAKYLYKCIPDDKHLPSFLVPYEQPIHFSKVFKNKFVIFQFDHWNDQHPHGKLLATIGEVDHLDAFYEYQLYCKSIHISLTQFSNKAREQLQKQSQTEYIHQILQNPHFHIEDRRTTVEPFSIDPNNSADFDDAFSIYQNPQTNNIHVTVYIANVFVWLETLHLWKSFTDRVSTIYLPDRKRPMLPTILSDNLCSLQANQDRFAFAMDLVYSPLPASPLPASLIDVSFKMVLIRVAHNFNYENPALIKYPPYISLYDITQKLQKNTTDSHDVVSYWMVQMNAFCGRRMAESNIGIFRQATFTRPVQIDDIEQSSLSTASKRMITMWNNVSGQYVLRISPENNDEDNIHHDVMKLSNYTHVTSPIRRLVDLINQIWMFSTFRMIDNISQEAEEFLEKWLGQLEYVNTAMRSIRKIQSDCEILGKCVNNPRILESNHTGVLFDKVNKNDGGFVYMVYLEGLNLLTRLKTYADYSNYTTQTFRLFLFVDEHSLKKKIRIQELC